MRRILSIAIILGLTFVGDSTAQSGQPAVAEVAGEAIPAEVFRTRYIDYLLKTGLADTSPRRAAFLKRLIRVKLIVQEAKTGGITEAVPYLFEKEGIYRKLLLDLGINTIYFNPIFYARSLHKYDGASFHHIDPYFGPDPDGDLAMIADEDGLDPASWRWTAADRLFLRLLDEAHARGLRVIIDGVFNHTGRDFFAFKDLRENQQDSPYKDGYIVTKWDDPSTPEDEFDHEGWWGYKPLSVFADNEDGLDLHPGPRQDDEAVVVVINRSDASQRACRWRPKARGSKLFFLPPTMRWA